MFASSYPKNKLGGTAVQDFDGMLFQPPIPLQKSGSGNGQKPPQKPQQRTPIEEIVTEGYRPGNIPKQQISSSAKNGIRKFLAILLIVFVGAFLFSSFSYTISDTIFSKFGVQFFAEGGHPSMMIIVIHSLIFLLLIYLIVSVLSWC